MSIQATHALRSKFTANDASTGLHHGQTCISGTCRDSVLSRRDDRLSLSRSTIDNDESVWHGHIVTPTLAEPSSTSRRFVELYSPSGHDELATRVFVKVTLRLRRRHVDIGCQTTSLTMKSSSICVHDSRRGFETSALSAFELPLLHFLELLPFVHLPLQRPSARVTRRDGHNGTKNSTTTDVVKSIAGFLVLHICFVELMVAAALLLELRVQKLVVEFVSADPVAVNRLARAKVEFGQACRLL